MVLWRLWWGSRRGGSREGDNQSIELVAMKGDTWYTDCRLEWWERYGTRRSGDSGCVEAASPEGMYSWSRVSVFSIGRKRRIATWNTSRSASLLSKLSTNDTPTPRHNCQRTASSSGKVGAYHIMTQPVAMSPPPRIRSFGLLAASIFSGSGSSRIGGGTRGVVRACQSHCDG